MAKDVIITPADGDIQFENSSGTEAGKIEQSGNDLVLSNAVGDILIGDGTADVYIGDGSNNVDIVFEQNGSIRGEAGSSVDITLGSSDTDIIISGSTFNIDPDANFAGIINASNKLIFTGTSGYILFDREPSGDTGAYEGTTSIPLLKIDKGGVEKTILERVSQEGGILLGADDSVIIAGGDTRSTLRANLNESAENVILASESGFHAYGFPDNMSGGWSDRQEFRFYTGGTDSSLNGLWIGDGGNSQFIDLNRNLKNIGTINSGAITTSGMITTTAAGSLLRKVVDSWSTATTHDLLYQGWHTNTDDYIYLKSPGNSTTNHGIAFIGDNVIALGRTNVETGAPELTSASSPIDENWFVLNSTSATFAGVVKADGNIALGNISGLARIQHEGSGQLKMLSSGDSHIATFTSTGTTFASDVTVSGDLLIGNTSQDPKKIIISQIGASTSENTSLMLDGNGVVVVRNLGSNAFNSTTIPTDHGDHAGLYLPIGGGTLTGDLHISNNAAPADDLTLLTLQNGNSTGDISTPNTFIDFEFKDSNTNVVPQARIGAHAGDGGDADSQVKEGKGYLTFHTSDTTATSGTVAPPERVRIAHNGNVGIGEINPSSKLEVGGEIDATGGDGYRIEGKPWANWGSDLLTLGDFDGEGYATRIMGSNSSEVMRVTGNNVGIGTILPASKLEVQTGYIISSGSGASDLGFVLDRAGLDTYQIRHLDGGLTIFNETDNRKEMTFLGNGNVGIGTTSPDHKLEIGLTSTVALAAQPAEPLHVSNNGLSVDGRVLISVKHTAINTASAIGAGLKMTAAAVTTGTPSYFDSLIYLESAGPGSDTIHSAPKAIKFYVDNHDTAAGDGTNYNQLGDLAMTIAESANVGIGTSTPDYKLEVSGTLGVSRLSGIIFGGSAGTGTGNKIYGDLVNNFYISTAAASAPYSSNTRFTILNSNGNVGIATTSPSEKLHVYNGTAYVTPVSYAANQDAYALKVGAYNNASFDMGLKVKSTSGGSPYLSFSTTSADDVLTMWQTKVGIGVANPETKLHIKGSSVTSFTGTGEHQFRIESDTTNNRYTGIGFSQASDRDIAKIAMKRTSAGSHLYFGTSNNYGNGITNEALVIDHSGNVGIGDTTPETALEVAGTSTTENLAFKKPTADNQFRGEIVTFGDRKSVV